MKQISDKRAKKLAERGVKLYGSSIAPSVKPKKASKKKPIGRGPMMQRRSKPKARKAIPKTNPERQKRSARRSAKKHRDYMASETRKIVDVRAGGRCEVRVMLRAERGEMRFAGVALPGQPVMLAIGDRIPRCEETEGLQHHHVTYSRYGGNELPEDMVVACKPHHDYLEAQKPAGNRRSRSKRANAA